MRLRKFLPISFLVIVAACYDIHVFAQKSIELIRLTSQADQLFVSGNIQKGIDVAQQGLALAQNENSTSSIVYFDYMLSKFYRLQNQIDSAITCLTHASAFIRTKQDKLRIDNQLGEILLDMGASNMAIPYLRRLVSNETKLTQKFYNINLLGRAYLLSYKNNLAVSVFKEQLQVAQKIKSKHFIANAYNNIGFAFYVDSNYVKSYRYFTKCIALIENNPLKSNSDTTILVNAYQNLCLVDNAVGDYDSLIHHFETSLLLLPNWKKLKAIGMEEFQEYINVLIRQGDAKRAKEYIDFFSKKALSNTDKFKLSELKMELYLWEGQIENIKQEYVHFLQLRTISTREKTKKNNQYADLIGSFYLKTATQAASINQAKEAIELEKQQSKLTFFIYLVVLVAALSITLFYINQSKRRRLISEQQLLEKEKENLEMSLQLKQKDLSNIAIDISQRNEELEVFLHKFKGVAKEHPEKVKDKLLSELKSLKNSIASKTTLNEFLKNNDVVNSAFYQKLTQLHPNLTQYEIELCSYFLINLSVQDIANIRGISPNSVRINKMRLKKKLLLRDKDLIVYLKTL